MYLFSLRSSKKKNNFSLIRCIGSSLIFILFLLHYPHIPFSNANEINSLSESDDELAELVDPLHSTCYDWRGNTIPCIFKRPYAELLYDKPIPDPRFADNKDGTVTDNLTGLIRLKNTRCLGMMDWDSAILAAKGLLDSLNKPRRTSYGYETCNSIPIFSHA